MKNDKDLSTEYEQTKRPVAYPSIMSISEAASYLMIIPREKHHQIQI